MLTKEEMPACPVGDHSTADRQQVEITDHA